jgi:hypothetical protein
VKEVIVEERLTDSDSKTITLVEEPVKVDFEQPIVDTQEGI